MKVAVNILGRFHFFDLAKQLEKHNVLEQLITSYPKFKAKEWNIKDEHINSLVYIEIFRRILFKSKLYSPFIDLYIKKLYGFISRNILKNNIDIYVFFGGNSFNYKTIDILKNKNIVTICDEGSSHVLYQKNILEEEYKLLGLKYKTKQKEEAINQTIQEYEKSNYIMVPSSFVKRSFIEQGVPEEKLLVNPYGVDLSSFKQIPKEDNIFRVIFCGTLSIQKGSHYLLQAFYELNLLNSELWHIGNISDEMKPFIKKYQSDKIIYKGSYSQNELYKLYSQGNVFCIPSLQEGMAMVQLQAMACGLSLICTTNTGGDDLITKDGEEGFVIPIRDVETLKEKILYLYENRDICYEMGQKAKKRVSSGFTWEDYGNRYIENLQRIMEMKSGK